MRKAWILAAILVLALGLTAPVPAQEDAPKPTKPATFGSAFPGAVYKNLNPTIGGQSIDLGDSLGKKALVLFYWIPGNPRADEILVDLQEKTDAAGDKVAMYVIAYPRPGRGLPIIQEGIGLLGIHVPVLEDEGFVLGQQLRVQTVPNITLIDSDGVLRLTNGAALSQVLEYKLNLGDAIDRMAAKKNVTTYGYLPRYYPVNELVGEKCPDFTAPWITTKAEQTWSNLLKDDKVNVLVFWSVDCPHCRKSLPELSAWLKENPEGFNVISAAKVTSEAGLIKTKEFCELNEIAFPTLIDQDLAIAEAYQVTSTPTTVIIGPDGVVDSVVLSGSIEETLEKKRQELLGKG